MVYNRTINNNGIIDKNDNVIIDKNDNVIIDKNDNVIIDKNDNVIDKKNLSKKDIEELNKKIRDYYYEINDNWRDLHKLQEDSLALTIFGGLGLFPLIMSLTVIPCCMYGYELYAKKQIKKINKLLNQ